MQEMRVSVYMRVCMCVPLCGCFFRVIATCWILAVLLVQPCSTRTTAEANDVYDVDFRRVDQYLRSFSQSPNATALAVELAALLDNPVVRALLEDASSGSTKQPVRFYLPGDATSWTGDNCYIIKMRPDTPSVLLELLKTRLVGHLGATIDCAYERLFSGLTVCFPQHAFPLQLLQSVPWIEYIERDTTVAAGQIQRAAPWGLARISQPRLPLLDRFGFDHTGKGIDVFVLDSGIFSEHPEFGGRARLVYNAIERVEADLPATSHDCSGHGTEVASIIAGAYVGVAKQASIKAIQVLGCNGNGRNSDLIHALEWVASHREGRAILHMSLGGPKSRALDEAVAAIVAAGIPVVLAAGNASQNACDFSPGGSMKAITVGALTETDARAEYSNYGHCVSLFAPGDNILAATQPTTDKIAQKPPANLKKLRSHPGIRAGRSRHDGLGRAHDDADADADDDDARDASPIPVLIDQPLNGASDWEARPLELGYNEGYVLSSGTSMAAPFVTGVLALLMQKHPDLDVSGLWQLVHSLAVKDVMQSGSLKGSPNLLLQAPHYDARSTKVLVPALVDYGSADYSSASVFSSVSLKTALWIAFIVAMLLSLLITLFVVIMQIRKKHRASASSLVALPPSSEGLHPMDSSHPSITSPLDLLQLAKAKEHQLQSPSEAPSV